MRLVNPSLLPEGAVSIRVCQDEFTLFNKDNQYWSESNGKWKDLSNFNFNFPRYELVIDLVGDDLYPNIAKLSEELKADRARIARLEEKLAFYENVLKGEATHTIPCDHGKAFRIRVDVRYAVETDSETHVPDIDTLVDAKRYCRQMNIEDKFGDGRIDMGGMTGSDYGQFIEQNAKMLHDILIMAEETKAYLATLPESE